MYRPVLSKALRTANFSTRAFSNSAIRMGVTVGESRSLTRRPVGSGLLASQNLAGVDVDTSDVPETISQGDGQNFPKKG